MDHLLHLHAPAGFDAGPSWVSIVLVWMLVMALLIHATRGARARRIAPQSQSPWRVCAFMGGLLTVWVALGSPLAGLHHELLLAHMLQHLLLSLCAAPLFLLGASIVGIRPWQRVPGRVPRTRAERLFGSAPMRALGRTLAAPAVCWGVSMLVLVGWHLPALFDLAWRSARWHAIECASFFVSGLLFWLPVIRPWPGTAKWPRWSMPLYLFTATLPCDVLSAFLAFSDRLVYPAYALAPRHAGMTALQDQAGAGALMWMSVTFAYGVPAAVITLAELSRPQQSRDLNRVTGA